MHPAGNKNSVLRRRADRDCIEIPLAIVGVEWRSWKGIENFCTYPRLNVMYYEFRLSTDFPAQCTFFKGIPSRYIHFQFWEGSALTFRIFRSPDQEGCFFAWNFALSQICAFLCFSLAYSKDEQI